MESKNYCMRSRQRPLLFPSLLFHGVWAFSAFVIYDDVSFSAFGYNALFFFFFCPNSLAMFYVIALAGAHKRVIKQLRNQLEMVGLPKSTCLQFMRMFERIRDDVKITVCHVSFCSGGQRQAFPNPEAVPGSEILTSQIACVQISGADQQKQPQLPHQLLQQFQWWSVPCTPDSGLFHTCVKQWLTVVGQ